MLAWLVLVLFLRPYPSHMPLNSGHDTWAYILEECKPKPLLAKQISLRVTQLQTKVMKFIKGLLLLYISPIV